MILLCLINIVYALIGILTGDCGTEGYCMAKAWCPVEKEDKSIRQA